MNERRTDNISTADIANRPEANKEEKRDQREETHEPRDSRDAAGHGNDRSRAGADDERQMPASTEQEALQLIPQDAVFGFRERWSSIQIKFVDEPKDSVRQADGLVAEVVQVVSLRFAEARKDLEGRWSQGSEVSTEDLRQALQHYRSFFQRLLAV